MRGARATEDAERRAGELQARFGEVQSQLQSARAENSKLAALRQEVERTCAEQRLRGDHAEAEVRRISGKATRMADALAQLANVAQRAVESELQATEHLPSAPTHET
ncbi:hypothetical protein T492DRAFT_1003818 [Pavlovales sp. CCMP2436]|nr:hypothetical protein T492DRAFT_1003818 [Pavlovales sp. CCMP2436]